MRVRTSSAICWRDSYSTVHLLPAEDFAHRRFGDLDHRRLCRRVLVEEEVARARRP
jgi:hypothetical protein